MILSTPNTRHAPILQSTTESLLLNTIKANNISLNVIEKNIIASAVSAAAAAAAATAATTATTSSSSSSHLLKNFLTQNPTINLATALNLTLQQQQQPKNRFDLPLNVSQNPSLNNLPNSKGHFVMNEFPNESNLNQYPNQQKQNNSWLFNKNNTNSIIDSQMILTNPHRTNVNLLNEEEIDDEMRSNEIIKHSRSSFPNHNNHHHHHGHHRSLSLNSFPLSSSNNTTQSPNTNTFIDMTRVRQQYGSTLMPEQINDFTKLTPASLVAAAAVAAQHQHHHHHHLPSISDIYNNTSSPSYPSGKIKIKSEKFLFDAGQTSSSSSSSTPPSNTSLMQSMPMINVENVNFYGTLEAPTSSLPTLPPSASSIVNDLHHHSHHYHHHHLRHQKSKHHHMKHLKQQKTMSPSTSTSLSSNATALFHQQQYLQDFSVVHNFFDIIFPSKVFIGIQ